VIAFRHDIYKSSQSKAEAAMKRFAVVYPSVVGLSLYLLLSHSAALFAADKPLLSFAIARVIDAKGPAAAIQQFADAYATDREKYTVDMRGVSKLSKKYMRANNYQAAVAVMQIANPYMQEMMADSLAKQTPAVSGQKVERAHKEKGRQAVLKEQEKQRQADKHMASNAMHHKAMTPGILTGKSLIDADIEYSAASYLDATNPGGRKFHSILTIHHAAGMTRYSNPKNKHQAISIFRFDKGLLWQVIPEPRGFEGVKLYQEFKLTSGTGISSHLDELMRARYTLQSPDSLTNLGKETVAGYTTTHFSRKINTSGYGNISITDDYWVSDNGILIKMQHSAAGDDFTGFTLETKNIKWDHQDPALFVPPPDYRKAGHRISWKAQKEKQQKLDAGLK
jgi:hypothetical protein